MNGYSKWKCPLLLVAFVYKSGNLLFCSLTLAVALVGCTPEDSGRGAPTARKPADRLHPDGIEAGQHELAAACSQTAEYWRRQLGTDGHSISRPPFVLAGNLADDELLAWHVETVRPASLAMGERYFEQDPDRPVVVLLFRDAATYRAEAARLFGDHTIGRHGYYRRHLNTIVVNAESGRAAMLHELTHALMAFDFPHAPTWLREGMATLHEDCRIELHPPRIVPLPGARRATLRRALADGRLPSLEALLQSTDFEGAQQAVFYAMARHFCRFLDEQGVLESVYRSARAQPAVPNERGTAIRRSLGVRSTAEVEHAFLRWVSRAGPSS